MRGLFRFAFVILILLVFLPNTEWNLYAASESFVPEPYQEMACSVSGTSFSLYAPTASEVRVNLYKDGRGGEAFKEVELKKSGHGFWKANVSMNLIGNYYTFQILYKDEWLNETPGLMAHAVGVNGHRAAILDLDKVNPPGWSFDTRPRAIPFTDMILYDLHLRDYSMGKQSGIVNKGKYLSLTELGSTNSNAFSTGIDHLVDLGVSHVLLMPVFDFETDDESRPKDVIRNWNYQPMNLQVPEGMYSTKPFDPSSRILEFKQMVQALHKSGIRVMMDMNMGHTATFSNSAFTLTQPGQCYRLKPDGSPSNASGYGNELATEKPFIRQYLLQTLEYWIKEYHIDGFKFDQMGVIDIETINQIKKKIDSIDPSIFLCGDGFAVNPSVLPNTQRALASNSKWMPGIAFFNDAWEIALKGNSTDSTDLGFVNGRFDLEDYVRCGIVGKVRHQQVFTGNSLSFLVNYAASPSEVIQYLSSPLGFTLFDQLNEGRKESMEKISRRTKLASSLLMTSQGIPFMYSGEELLRSRGGIPNTALTPDSINRVDWRNKTYYNKVYEFTRGMVEMRRLHPAFRMNSALMIQKNLRFLDIPQKCVVGFVMEGFPNGDSWKNILVIHNANDFPVTVQIPPRKWIIVVQDGNVDLMGISDVSNGQIVVPPISTLVAFQ